jgi:hypothetical protein
LFFFSLITCLAISRLTFNRLVGGNVSSAAHGFGGNAPVSDAFTQNTV